VAYGDHVRRFLLDVPGVADEKIFVSGQAIEASRFVGSVCEAAEPAIVFVGQLEPHKGVRELLAAFARIPDLDIELRVVGEGSLADEVAAAARHDPRIRLLGRVPQTDLGAVLAAGRCLVVPSVTTRWFRETWGLVVNEAMTVGLPVIASDAVGAAAAGLVSDGRNGYVVGERDLDALAARMRRLALDRPLALRLGAAARADVAAFDYARMTGAFLSAASYARRARASNSGQCVGP
jgi:glycosyltransferase involved in cell wall biosynthesis